MDKNHHQARSKHLLRQIDTVTIHSSLSEERKREIEAAVEKTIADYGETLRLLGNE